jgi:hypothetical protein
MVGPFIQGHCRGKPVKMLLLSAKLVTQSLTEKAALLTLVNKRLKFESFASFCTCRLNQLFSNKACLSSFLGGRGLQRAGQEA